MQTTHERRAAEAVQRLTRTIATTSMPIVMSSCDEALAIILATVLNAENDAFERIALMFDGMSASSAPSISPAAAAAFVRSLKHATLPPSQPPTR
jgi:hypothetical protein